MPAVSWRAIGPSISFAMTNGKTDWTTIAQVATTSMKIK
jgi:hypothetical protein